MEKIYEHREEHGGKGGRDQPARVIARETGARIGMVSTGPGREETIFVDEFLAELQSMEDGKSRAQAKR